MDMMVENPSSRLPGFYSLPAGERVSVSAKFSNLNEQELAAIHQYGVLSQELTDMFIENAVGTFALPLGIATNFLINEKNVLIPMAVEESSVLAAASHGAKLARSGGGFYTQSSESIMTGQIQLFLAEKNTEYDSILKENKEFFIDYANRGQDRLLNRGGGVKDIEWYFIDEIKSLIINLQINTCDAMGANIVNTICEKLSPVIAEQFPNSEIGLRILTNLSDRRISKAECAIPPSAFNNKNMSGHEVIEKIYKAWQFAYHDIYRATTHNKGVMNGIDPVLIATGNDWRAIEAGAHAYSCKDGTYRPMTNWSITKAGELHGSIELPMAVGTVGGVTKLHPTAKASLKILGQPAAKELAEIVCAVGLAQNLSALRALGSEGIQQGHMALHDKNIKLMRSNRNLN